MIYYNKLTKTYSSTLLETARLSHGFSTRDSGDGRSVETVLSFLRINQVIFKKLVIAEQIHSANAQIFVSGNNLQYEKLDDIDGIVTSEEKVVLAVRTADCIPVLLADIKNNIVGISHNGWRGTLKGITPRVIALMEEQGAKKEEIIAVLGPGIGVCCYDIPEERYFEFMGEFENDYESFPFRGGKRYMNLLKLNYELLLKDGLKKKNIDYFPFCTVCNKEYFYSYRRDYHKHKQKFGEMFSYIVLN